MGMELRATDREEKSESVVLRDKHTFHSFTLFIGFAYNSGGLL